MTTTPAEVFPVGSYIRDELRARRWSRDRLAVEMGGDFTLNRCIIDLMIYVDDRGLRLDERTAAKLSRAFGTSAELWLKIDKAWRESPLRSSHERGRSPSAPLTTGGE